MKNLNDILFSLIAPVLNAECGTLSSKCEALDEATLRAVYALAKKHDLGHLIAAAINNAECKAHNVERGAWSTEIMAELEQTQLTAVWRVRNIENEQGRVRKIFEEAGIPFILLKGSVTRSYYPEPWMRTSSDIDLLVPEDRLDDTVCLLRDSLGSKISTRAPRDASLFAPSGVHFDVHTAIEGDTEDDKILTRVWDTSRDNGGFERFMSPETFYFHHVSHMAKHMRNGGCGIRPFIDLYLINRELPYDRGEVLDILSEFGLSRFEGAAVRLSRAWMCGESCDGLEAMEEYIFTGGVYGSVAQNVASKQRGSKNRLGYLWRRVFMPYSELKKRHKALDGRPWLTPFFEVWRWLSLFDFMNFKRSARELATTARLDGQSVKDVASLLDSLGI